MRCGVDYGGDWMLFYVLILFLYGGVTGLEGTISEDEVVVLM
jgi:hypothetical protein